MALRHPPALRPACPAHGPMELRPLAGQTREQRWCGVWYDCRDGRGGARRSFGSSVLLPSPELTAQLAEQRAASAARTPMGLW